MLHIVHIHAIQVAGDFCPRVGGVYLVFVHYLNKVIIMKLMILGVSYTWPIFHGCNIQRNFSNKSVIYRTLKLAIHLEELSVLPIHMRA